MTTTNEYPVGFIAADWIRASSIGNCAHRVARRISGHPSDARRPMAQKRALTMGTALEPMINNEMRDDHHFRIEHGAPEEQLELRVQFETVVDNVTYQWSVGGHPDGIISLPDEPMSYWAAHNLPQAAIIQLEAGERLLWEVKTMGDAAFREFKTGGLLASQFLAMYIDQVQTYMYMLNEAILVEEKLPGALLAAYNPGTKRLEFEYIPYNPDHFAKLYERAETLAVLLLTGILPEPEHDGSAAECFYCEYSHLCPAARAKIITSQLEDPEGLLKLDALPIGLQGNIESIMSEVNELTVQYGILRDAEAEAKKAKAEIKDRVSSLLDTVGTNAILTEHVKVKRVEVAGRRTVDQEKIKEMLGVTELPKKQGKPHYRYYIDSLYGPSHKPESESSSDD